MVMWPFYPDLLARAVPRYTSYPTAADFNDAVGHEDMAAALDSVPEGAAVSLYVHIPYCHSICWYCGCNTGAANRTARLEAYLARLHEEIDMIARGLDGRGRIERVAFGGGSPNAMPPRAFAALVEQIGSRFHCAGPILSVELDPRGFDQEWAAAMRDVGVTRASLGVQTFDPALQAAIGRVQPENDIRRAVTLLRDAGITSINFDLMYGLPGQEKGELAATLDTSLALLPERLAVFGYAHVPSLIPRQRRIDAHALPGAAARFSQAALAHARLTRAGYTAVGFDHFARPDDALAQAATDGTLRRNFQGFTEDPAEVLIGIGASAISEFPDRFLQVEKNTGRWHAAIASGRFAIARGVRRTAQDRARGRAIEGILCRGTANLGTIPDHEAIVERLADFTDARLIGWKGKTIVLTSDALPYARAIASRLDAYRLPNDARFSNAV